MTDLDGVVIAIVGADPPDAIAEWGGDGVTRESLDGGTVVHLERERENGLDCRSYALADNGVWLHIWPTADGPNRQQCDQTRTIARGVVEQLGRGVPEVNWPVGSLYRKDICAVAESSGIAASLGVDPDLSAGPAHLTCTYSNLYDRKLVDRVEVSIEAHTDRTHPLPYEEALTVAGHRTMLVDSQTRQDGRQGNDARCHFVVDFGPNDVARRHGRRSREALGVDVSTTGPYDCKDAVPALRKLVEALE